MTEDEIERIYEKSMAELDERLVEGSLKPKAYEAESWRLYEWSMERYRELEIAPFRKALQEIVSQIDQGGDSGKVFARDACIAEARRVLR
jgi:hypothetical protein